MEGMKTQPDPILPIKSNFREWTFDSIDDAFGTRQSWQNEALDQWLAMPYTFSEYEKKYISELQEVLILGVDDWNEVELENKFISPLIVFAKIDNPRYAYFLERELSVTIGQYELTGKVDGLIATGFRNPKVPYFCLNEYKRQTDPDGNPQGQALVAMLAAQQKNQNGLPLYGCYIIGKLWRFMTLTGKEYCLSPSFAADTEDVYDIFKMLKSLKALIEKQLDSE